MYVIYSKRCIRINYLEEKEINGKIYRLVELRNRKKYVSYDGSFINPYRPNQKVTFYYNHDGYPCCGGGIPAHLYVANAWVDGYFDGAEINHKDFNRENYNASNLEWVRHSDNIIYSVNNNSDVWNASKQGINNGRATFTENEVINIRKLYDNGYNVAEIIRMYYPKLIHAKDYKNIYSTFSNICKRRTWKHIA